MPKNERTIFVFGPEKVGKTSLINQLKLSMFDDKYVQTFHNVSFIKFDCDGKMNNLIVNDISGKFENTLVRNSLIMNCEGFLGVYSVTSAISFLNLQKYVAILHALKQGKRIPMVIVGCKLDLVSEREVPENLAAGFSDLIHCPYFETSAKDKNQVLNIFAKLVQEMDKVVLEVEENNDTVLVEQKDKKTRCCALF